MASVAIRDVRKAFGQTHVIHGRGVDEAALMRTRLGLSLQMRPSRRLTRVRFAPKATDDRLRAAWREEPDGDIVTRPFPLLGRLAQRAQTV